MTKFGSGLVKHRGFREVASLAADVNDAALGLLVGDRLARFTLDGLGAEASQRKLSDLYADTDVSDVARFDFPIFRAVEKLQEAERELCLMAVPFAVSLYNEYLVIASNLLELAHVARPPLPAEELMLGRLTAHLEQHGVAVDQDWAALVRLIVAVRNRIVHAVGIPGDDTLSRWTKLPPASRQAWVKVTGREMPFDGPAGRLPWGGPEIAGVFFVVREGLCQINRRLQQVLPRDFWADLLIHEQMMDGGANAARPRSGPELAQLALFRGYGPLALGSEELEGAARRGPFTGFTPNLKPYWRRGIEQGTPHTQPVTRKDVRTGRIRVHSRAKHLLPAQTETIKLKLRERSITCRYNPEPEKGAVERSGVIYIGSALSGLVTPGQVLFVFSLSPSEVGLQ